MTDNELMRETEAVRIIEDAVAYNKDYPEAEAQIRNGEPIIQVIISNANATGWVVRISVTPVVRLPSGGVAAASDPETRTVRVPDGRLTKTAVAKRYAKHLGFQGATVPVEFKER